MKKTCLAIFVLLQIISIPIFAARLYGVITNASGEPLPFASITIKNINLSTAANQEGKYFIDLAPGNYFLFCRYVGYEKKEIEINIGNEPQELNIILATQKIELKEVVIKADAEDPAYEIIRNAIRKRKSYLSDQQAYTCEVYSKGVMQLRDFPRSFMGKPVDFEDGDTSKKKMLYLAETVSKLSVGGKEKTKIEVLSTRVSGRQDGFGFAAAEFISFYENMIDLGEALNPRGFVSPIADNALSMYRYKYEGTYFEDRKQIHSIRVMPRRKFEPCFSGTIQIVDDDWCIHSLKLNLTKQSQMAFADTLRIEQLYQQQGKDFWVIQNQVIYPAIKFFGFDAYGSFSNVYSHFNAAPVFDKKFFDRVFIRYENGSNKKSFAYWDSIRPLSLSEEERLDYVKKDSLEQKRKDPHYLDSVDRVRNKVKWADILLLGKSISQERKKRTYEWQPLLNSVSFYPGEGWVIDVPFEITQRVTDRKRHVLIPHLRYGFASERLYGWGTYKFFGGKKYLSTFSLSGGARPFQYNPDNPVDPFVNSFYALRSEDNYLKIYAANYVRAAFSKGVGNGLILRGVLSYQERIPFDNATDFSWQKTNNKTYSPNFPNEVLTAPFQRHEALSFTVGLQYQPQTSYIEFPDRIVNIGSKWPLLNLQYTKGIPNLLGSNVDYDKWQAELQDEWNLRLFGTFNWKYKAGGFLNTSNAPIQDWQHFAGNRFNFSGDFLNTFQLPEYYQFSNTASLFNAVFAEYHLNGFLTNKLPFFNKLNWHLVTGARALWFNQQSYSEWNIGLENIFKILRIDMICGVLNGNRITPDWRIGTKINLSRKED